MKSVLRERTENRRVLDTESPEVEVREIIIKYGAEDLDEKLQKQAVEPSLKFDRFEVFPNPNDGQFQLNFELAGKGALKIRILNPMGQQVYEENKDDFSGVYENQISVGTDLSPGIYFLQVERGKEGRVERIVIK